MSKESEKPENWGEEESIWECLKTHDQINPETLEEEKPPAKVFIEWVIILDKAKSMGNPCDFVMEYRQLLHECKKTADPEEFVARWENFWGLMLLASEIATGRQSTVGNPWRLRFQSTVAPKKEDIEHRISLIAEMALTAIKTAATFTYADMEKLPVNTRPTPESRMVVLAHWFCANFQKDPQLILRAERMELETLRAAAREFSPTRAKSL